MPLHDWTRVEAGVFHSFHVGWIAALREQLNAGLLPAGYYADAEQVVRPWEADVLTLATPTTLFSPPSATAGVALAEATPQAHEWLRLRSARQLLPHGRRMVIRHASGHRVVALIEIVSPANKDRRRSVVQFVRKAALALRQGIHVLIADVFSPGPHDPAGLHGAVAGQFVDADDQPIRPDPALEPLRSFAAFAAAAEITTFVEFRAVGAALPEMPLFLAPERYVNLPLEESYARAWRGTPQFWRDVLEPPG